MRSSSSPFQGVRTSPLRVIALAFVSLLLMSGFAWAAPTAPSNLTVFLDRTSANKADPNNDTYVFFWNDNSTDETSFVITYNNGNSFATVTSSTTSTTGSVGVSYKITSSLAVGTTIQWQVAAVNASGTSSASAVTSASTTTVQTAQMVTPTSVSVTANSETAVTVTWTDSSTSADGDELWLSANGGTYTYLGDVYFYQTKSISVPGLSPGTPYQIKVRAYQEPAVAGNARTYSAYSTPSSSVNTKDGFTSRTYQPITYNQPFTYTATTSTGSTRFSWNITGLPTGLSFNSSTGVISGTPTVTGVFSCPMTASFFSGWTTNSTLKLRIIRAAAAPVTGTTISSQTMASGGNTSISLTDKFSDPDSESAVRLITNKGTMDFILYNTATPQTVTNFLSYVNNASSTGNYNGAVFHRSEPGFVVQGGAFKVQSSPNNFSSIVTTASPTNEPGISNLTGTVAMAKLGTDPNSATDQFFVNLADNSSNLDNQNGGFTVFARVAGSGMTTANAIASAPRINTTAKPSVNGMNIGGVNHTDLTNWPVLADTNNGEMDTSQVVSITSAAPVAVLSYSVTGNTNSSAVSASISGTNVQINGVAGGQSNVTVTATDLDGNTVSQTFAVTVNQAPVFTSAAPSAGGVVGTAYPFTYTASGYPVPTFSVTSGALPAGLSLSSAGVISGSCTTVGTYTGVVTASNSNGSTTQNFSITVNQLPAFTNGPPPTTGAISTAYSFTYTKTGSPAPTFSVTAGALPPGLSLGSSTGAITGTPTTAGVYTGTVTISNAAGTATQNFSITIPQLSGSVSLGSLAQAYDGNPKSATATTTPNGLTVTYTYNGSSTPPTTVGSYTVVGTISDTNYQGSATGTLVISKGTATVSLGGLTPTYDGTAKSATSSTTPSGLTVTYTYNGSSTAPTNAGTYTVIGTVNDTNYQGSATSSMTIAKATATVSLGGLSPTYDGTAKSVTSTTTPNGLTVTYTYNGSSTAPTNAGSYTVIGTISDTNYQGSATNTLNIAKASGSVSLSSLSQTYDGTAKSATSTTTPNGLTVTYTYNGSSTAPTNAGSYTVIGTISDTNYQGSATNTLNIAKASGSVSLGSLSQTYDGTAKSATSTTTPNGLTVTYTYNGSSTAPTNAGSYTVIGTISDTNYQGSSSNTLNVAQASASIALGGLTQVYDGTAKSVTATTTPVGLAVSITYNGSSTAPSGFGSYTVAASISDTNYTGTQGGTLVIQGQSSSSWKTQHFTSGQISAGLSADNADPDGDGLKNLAEYAMGTDPLVRNATPQPTVDANGLTLIFTRPKALPDVIYSAESTDSFGSWSPVTLEVISDGPVQTVRARDTLSSGNTARRFMHLIFGTP